MFAACTFSSRRKKPRYTVLSFPIRNGECEKVFSTSSHTHTHTHTQLHSSANSKFIRCKSRVSVGEEMSIKIEMTIETRFINVSHRIASYRLPTHVFQSLFLSRRDRWRRLIAACDITSYPHYTWLAFYSNSRET